MSWQSEVDELRRRTGNGQEMDVPNGLHNSMGKGRMTVREGINQRCDSAALEQNRVSCRSSR